MVPLTFRRSHLPVVKRDSWHGGIQETSVHSPPPKVLKTALISFRSASSSSGPTLACILVVSVVLIFSAAGSLPFPQFEGGHGKLRHVGDVMFIQRDD